MEVVHMQAELEVDHSRYTSPSYQHNTSHQETNKNDQPTNTYAVSSSPYTQLDSTPQGVPSRSQARRNWLFPALLGGLIGALSVGAAVGGGLGAKLAQCSSLNNMNPTPQSPNVTSTTISDGLLIDYASPPASSIRTVKADCNTLDGSTQLSQYDHTYEVKCGKDLQGKKYPGESSGGASDTYLADIAALWAYSFQDCIDACSATTKSNMMKQTCRSVTFGRSIQGSKKANCWLKNDTIAWNQARDDDNYLSGRLFGS